ncbi:hypothetical protein [Jeotgalibacillus terrae]|uniref:Uncharacterized protein n=1 Tax=Jeotgalibacillus terrae TaxID=587735 RepID=A0ABW5ZP00_9BACL|nr:hypothetical protein [Jeotgalibacillus terrae]MBM7578130.1 hypothetical protein [Jeotgalibacillus terrae]
MEFIALAAFLITVYVIIFVTVISIIRVSRLAYIRKEIASGQYRTCVISTVAGGLVFATIIPLVSLFVIGSS